MSRNSGTATNSRAAGGAARGAGAGAGAALGCSAGAAAAGGGAEGWGARAAPDGAGDVACVNAGRLAQPTTTTPRTSVATTRYSQGRMGAAGCSALKDLLLANRHRFAPPCLIARQRDVTPRDAGGTTLRIPDGERQVITRGEVGRVLLPSRPFLRACAARGHEEGHDQRREPGTIPFHRLSPSNLFVRSAGRRAEDGRAFLRPMITCRGVGAEISGSNVRARENRKQKDVYPQAGSGPHSRAPRRPFTP